MKTENENKKLENLSSESLSELHVSIPCLDHDWFIQSGRFTLVLHTYMRKKTADYRIRTASHTPVLRVCDVPYGGINSDKLYLRYEQVKAPHYAAQRLVAPVVPRRSQ